MSSSGKRRRLKEKVKGDTVVERAKWLARSAIKKATCRNHDGRKEADRKFWNAIRRS